MKTPFTHPDDFVSFAIVVDGEVVQHLVFPKEHEMSVAIFSSDPKFIPVPTSNKPELGSKWDGENFVSVE